MRLDPDGNIVTVVNGKLKYPENRPPMSYDYLESAQEALEALQEYGAPCTLTWTPAPDSDAPNAATPDPLVVSAYGVVLDYAAKMIGTQPDSLIQAGDRQVLLGVFDIDGAAVPKPPAEAQIIAPDGLLYTVKGCKPLAPAGVAVLYDLNVRR